MIKPKHAVISFAAGFIFSFLISVISTHKFGHSLLRGLIFGIIICLVFAGLYFLYEKFLDDETDDVSSPSGENMGVTEKKAERGSKIDITISDERLTDDGEDLDFGVENNKHVMNKDDIHIEKNKADSFSSGGMSSVPEANTGASLGQKSADNSIAFNEQKKNNSVKEEFVPVDLSQPFESKGDKVSSVENDAAEEIANANRASITNAKAEDYAVNATLDELPDLGDFTPKATNTSGGFINDSDFSMAGQVDDSKAAQFPDGSKAKSHDAETMAKAIRTLLNK